MRNFAEGKYFYIIIWSVYNRTLISVQEINLQEHIISNIKIGVYGPQVVVVLIRLVPNKLKAYTSITS